MAGQALPGGDELAVACRGSLAGHALYRPSKPRRAQCIRQQRVPRRATALASMTLPRTRTVYSIRDASLTAKGREQARGLDRATRTNVQQEVELIVSSPFRRTMQTTLGGYPEAIERLGGKEKIILLPEAQECNNGTILRFERSCAD